MSNTNPLYNPEIYGSSSEGGTLTLSGEGPGSSGGDLYINPDGGKTGIGTTNPSNTLSVKGSADFSGNVGIGTTTPINTLSVNGNADINGMLNVNNNASFATKLGVGTLSPSSTLDVQGDVNVSDKIYCAKWKVTQLLQCQPGPLPISSTFTTAGGTLLIFVSGSGWCNSDGQIGLSVIVDGSTQGYSKSFTNEGTSHKAFVPTQLIVSGLAAGSHTLELSSWNGTQTDLNDFYTVTVTELPW